MIVDRCSHVRMCGQARTCGPFCGHGRVMVVLVGLFVYDDGMRGDDIDLHFRWYGLGFRASRSGDTVMLEYDGARHVLPEPGIGGLVCTVMPLVLKILERRGSIHLYGMDGFLHTVIVPFARWLGLSAMSLHDYSRRVPSSSCELVSFNDFSGWLRPNNCCHLMVPTGLIPGEGYHTKQFMSVGVMFPAVDNHDTGHPRAWLAVSGYKSGLEYALDTMLIGPYEPDVLVREFRVLSDNGWLDNGSAGLIVELARKYVPFHPSVPRNITMEDIIDGYPGASDYMSMKP